MKNRDALAGLLLKANDLGVLGRELDVDDINDLADYLDNNGAFVTVRCKDCMRRGHDHYPVQSAFNPKRHDASMARTVRAGAERVDLVA